MTPRERIAAFLLARDEGGDVIAWAEKFVRENRDAPHSGDCTKESHACNRCIVDRAMADVELIMRIVESVPED
jgi:hypothetical protein